MDIFIDSKNARELIDITAEVEKTLTGTGLINVMLMHTTAALTTADLDPGTDKDLLKALELMTPKNEWKHPHDPGHFPDHLWSSLIGSSLTLPYENGKLTLGSWQRLVLIELSGPRRRQLRISPLTA